jgi:hypothetical protein
MESGDPGEIVVEHKTGWREITQALSYGVDG